MSDKRWTASQGSAPGADPFGELCRKVLLLVAEDRLALSNYRPLIGFLKEIALGVVVATRSSGRLAEIEELGVRVIDFDHSRPSLNPVREASSAWAIGRVLEAEDPDVVHLVGLEAVILGGLASKLVPSRYVVVQMPGLAVSEGADGNLPRLYHAGALRLMASMLRRPESCLLVENADDLPLLRARGIDPGGRFAVLGGAGIDPQAYPALPAPKNATPIAAFVGQMVARNGIDILMQAGWRLAERGSPLRFELCGAVDHESREEIAADVLADWCAAHKARWPGHVADVREVWSRVDICVLPARTGGGVPRALLEAAACARPLVVTDVPGCRHFVRDGIEGLVVRREDPDALAAALDLLARDPEMRQRMGEAARLRLLHGFTETQVRQSLRAAYASMLGKRSA
jgi:glycosyltransferase involved in cell wall biosynthesis